jgi:hypothetical protein
MAAPGAAPDLRNPDFVPLGGGDGAAPVLGRSPLRLRRPLRGRVRLAIGARPRGQVDASLARDEGGARFVVEARPAGAAGEGP